MTGRDRPQDQLELVLADDGRKPAGRGWGPVAGEASLDLQRQARDLNDAEKETVLREAISILSACPDPKGTGKVVTGLVIGRIQSGKTLSFATLAALASDNGYGLIVVITGISLPLLSQSVQRLRSELGIDRHPWRWQHFTNPKEAEGEIIRATLGQWADPAVPREEHRTVVVTVMKNTRHLRALRALLSPVAPVRVPTLIVDDEADQASLNTAAKKGTLSATYRCIHELRALLPCHGYVEYTATPQAPLLINILDSLSPEFSELLTPGVDYTGGHAFFDPTAPDIVRTIPAGDISSDDTPVAGPPGSLLEALRIFYLGVAAEATRPVASRQIRSMIIHPTRLVAGHSEYHQWVRSIQSVWANTLRKASEDPDRIGLIEEFALAYADLQRTVADIPPFGAMAPLLPQVLGSTIVTEMNTALGRTPEVAWERSASHILVGGQAMDRGFTARGLTVTYMPRNAGVRQADTVQQRARFFGYKRKYLGYCRVYLDVELRQLFSAYVVHEDDVHQRLEVYKRLGTPLSEWKREFVLDRSLRPTRDAVIDIPYVRSRTLGEWTWPSAPQVPMSSLGANLEVVERFNGSIPDWVDDTNPRVPEFQRHRRSPSLPLRRVVDELLVRLRFGDPEDADSWATMLFRLGHLLDTSPESTARVVLMSNERVRGRTLAPDGTIPTLFQGPTRTDRGDTYAGDSGIYSPDDAVTVQVHRLRLASNPQPEPDAYPPAEDVVAVAVLIRGEDHSADIVVQPQGIQR